MTEKRYGFEMDKNCYKCIVDTVDEKLYTDKKQVVDLLNKLTDENEQLKDDIYDWKASAEDYLKIGKSLKKENEQLKTKNNAYIQDIEVFKEENTHLKLKNEQLKERNNRQCRQLDNLYTLIEKQDWKTLTGLIQELKEADERLQEEWGAYGDVE